MENNKEEIKETTEDIAKYAELESLAMTAGGKQLIKSLESDIKGSIASLCGKYKELPHIELIAILARFDERLKIYQTLTTASKKKKTARERLNELMQIISE